MQRIGIERYKKEIHGYAGLIEGACDDGSQWIMWLDQGGNPTLLWPLRDDSGAVQGDPISLS